MEKGGAAIGRGCIALPHSEEVLEQRDVPLQPQGGGRGERE